MKSEGKVTLGRKTFAFLRENRHIFLSSINWTAVRGKFLTTSMVVFSSGMLVQAKRITYTNGCPPAQATF